MGAVIAQVESAPPAIDWWEISPLLAVITGALLLLVIGALTRPWPKGTYAWATAAIAATAAVLAGWRWHDLSGADRADQAEGARGLIGGALAYDHLSLFLTIAICAAVVLVALLSDGNLERSGPQTPEPYALFLVAAAGAIVMASAADLIVLFLGLETLSLALYVLASSDRRRRASQEAGFKYFILGGFASAFFLYGIALIYGATQSTRLVGVATAFTTTAPAGGRSMFLLAGTALLMIGFGFKIAAVPFHFWQPDVYEGSPSTVTGFMASVGKVGAFAAMIRVLLIALPYERDDWVPVVWVLAVGSLAVGAILAVVQTNVKRMLAYSSINHAGFMLVALVAAGMRAGQLDDLGDGMTALVIYLLLYSVLVIGSFGVVAIVASGHDGDSSLDAFVGLSRRRPALALLLSVFLLAQAGVPATSGFIAKFGAIRAAVDEGSYVLAVIAMVSSVIAAYLYLRILVSVWFAAGDGAGSGDTTLDQRLTIPFSNWFALVAAAAFTLAVGLFPSPMLDLAQHVTEYVVG